MKKKKKNLNTEVCLRYFLLTGIHRVITAKIWQLHSQE